MMTRVMKAGEAEGKCHLRQIKPVPVGNIAL